LQIIENYRKLSGKVFPDGQYLQYGTQSNFGFFLRLSTGLEGTGHSFNNSKLPG
jgi:hypothetical protein